jgi:very-short-patch-repair endonuclease
MARIPHPPLRGTFPPGEGIRGAAMERNQSLKEFSRKLRKEMTKEENLLWYNFLRKYPARFRRQYIIGNYIADFYCHQAKLVIELDGSQHYEEAGQGKDAQRDMYFEGLGLQVLRIPNNAVTENFRGVCERIDSIIKKEHRK